MRLASTASQQLIVADSVKWITTMWNTLVFLVISLRHFPISPASSVFSPGNRKGEVFEWGEGGQYRVGFKRRSEQPLVFS
jgi:hypothetical protein